MSQYLTDILTRISQNIHYWKVSKVQVTLNLQDPVWLQNISVAMQKVCNNMVISILKVNKLQALPCRLVKSQVTQANAII